MPDPTRTVERLTTELARAITRTTGTTSLHQPARGLTKRDSTDPRLARAVLPNPAGRTLPEITAGLGSAHVAVNTNA
jgi:predicted transcriptional regulator